MWYCRYVFLALLCLTLLSNTVQAETLCSKKIDSFDFVVDYSGSMMMQSKEGKKPKVDIAKMVLTRINAVIPALPYLGGLHTVAPTSAVLNQGPWERATMDAAIGKLHSNFNVFGRMTPMGNGLVSYEPWMVSMQRNAAIILVTDGGNNRGTDLLDVVRNIYTTQRGLVVHIISFAETEHEKQTIRDVAALNPNTIVVDALLMASDDGALKQFVMDVWCDQTEEVIVLRGVNFAFNSSELNERAQNTLQAAAYIIRDYPNKKVIVDGWTDSVGSDSYNKTLSQKRADSVRTYLIQQGVPPSRLVAIGRGKSYKYTNETEEGRFLNRRVELNFQ